VKGLDARTLRDCRFLFQLYPQIRGGAVSPEFLMPLRIRGTVSRELPAPLSPEVLLRLSWSQLVELLAFDDPWKRAFFENEGLQANWSVRQLRRQIGSLPNSAAPTSPPTTSNA
jgi:hypothetical protein